MTTKPIPSGYHTVTPVLCLRDSRKAIEFYKKAFGAKENHVMPGPNGQGVMHADLTVGDSRIMLSDERPDCPSNSQSAQTLGASSVNFYLYVRDADASFKQAVSAGATAVRPIQEQFWGDRCGCVKDPFGYSWMLATHSRDLSEQEIAQGAEAAMSAHASH
jgi:uncharacterized glyoxalase superfamily protein PhnB